MEMDSDAEHDVYIEPPDVHDLTDEDSGDEDLDGECSVDKLSRKQLLAPAELRSRKAHSEDADDPIEVTSLETSSAETGKRKGTVKSTEARNRKERFEGSFTVLQM